MPYEPASKWGARVFIFRHEVAQKAEAFLMWLRDRDGTTFDFSEVTTYLDARWTAYRAQYEAEVPVELTGLPDGTLEEPEAPPAP